MKLFQLPEYFNNLRYEARTLRQQNATLERSRDFYKRKFEALQETVTVQTQTISTLKQQIEKLTKELTELKAILGIEQEKAKKFAGMIFKSNVKKENERDLNTAPRGAQPGHIPHRREAPIKIDREIVVHLSHCPECKNPLSETTSTDERIVEDLPETKIETTRYHIQRQWCGTCKKEVCAIPSGTIPFCHFGINILVSILFLKYRIRTPLSKISEIFQSQYSLSITQGAIQNILETLHKTFTKEYDKILKDIRNAPIKHADETSWRIDGINGWCWLFATPNAALYTIEETRGKGVPEKIFGRSPTGLLVRDDYGGYKKIPIDQQSCWAHLLRVSHEKVTQDIVSDEMKHLHQELKNLFLELNEHIKQPFCKKNRQKLFKKYTKIFQSITKRTYTHDDVKSVQTRIRNQGTNLIKALLYENAPLTNNHAERMIRTIVVTRKISGGSRSDQGSAIHAVNMSIMQTLSLKGKDFFSGVKENGGLN